MSSEDEYEYGSDEEYDYGSEEDQDEGAIEIENAFYEADDCKENDPKQALEIYEKCVRLETESGDEVKWRFKALQQIVTLQFRLDNHDQMVERYQEMLGYMESVTRNECTDSINRSDRCITHRHINWAVFAAFWIPSPVRQT
jgi:COP9 signalosome complex subunit 2